MRKVKLYIDGASRGNPGESGIGVVVYDESDEILEQQQCYLGSRVTNNQAEYKALLFGLDLISNFANEVEVYSDSELLVRQMMGEYKIRNTDLKTLYNQAVSKLKRFAGSRFYHIPRTDNRLADQLANAAIDAKGPRLGEL